MGRNKRRSGHAKTKGSNRSGNDERTDLIEKIDMENEKFFSYYKAQEIIPENEWSNFLDALRRPLPTSFRMAGSRQIANTLNSTIKEVYVPMLSNVIFEDQAIPPPVQIQWYPDGLAWQFNVPKKVLRKSSEFKKFHSFLVFETEVGNVSRQEAVSMLPPLFLDVEPHHKVMDMCAAPGSKTAQILEALHAQDTVTSSSIPAGLLIANDSDNKRTHLLIHQSARLPSPALMVTNLDASNYPAIKIPVPMKGGGTRLGQLLFDRILCDVPCSGDGTIRKNMGIWKSWQPGDGNGLHSLQVRILQRAMKLLKEDGRIVYSTCSLNPVENEAVVAEALKGNTEFYLVDVSSKLPELIRRPGLTKWRPTVNRTVAKTYASYDEFLASDEEESLKVKLTEGHWCPEKVESLNLHRCLRIYPHLQDTGGFFVAVLEKGKRDISQDVPAKDRKREANISEEIPEAKKLKLEYHDDVKGRNDNPQVTIAIGGSGNEFADALAMTEIEGKTNEIEKMSGDAATNSVQGATGFEANIQENSSPDSKIQQVQSPADGGGSFKENPYTFLSPEDPILLSCMERLHLTAPFPSSNVLVRNPTGDAVRSLYLANDAVKTIIENNDYSRIRLTAAGTKVFSKQEAGRGTDAQFRILGEGLPVIFPYVDPKTIISADLATLKTLIQSYYPLCSTFSDPFKSLIEKRDAGSHVVKFLPGELNGAVLTHELVLPIWKSNVSLTLMIDKKAKSALSMRLFGSDITTAGKKVVAEKIPSADNTPVQVGSEDKDSEMEA